MVECAPSSNMFPFDLSFQDIFVLGVVLTVAGGTTRMAQFWLCIAGVYRAGKARSMTLIRRHLLQDIKKHLSSTLDKEACLLVEQWDSSARSVTKCSQAQHKKQKWRRYSSSYQMLLLKCSTFGMIFEVQRVCRGVCSWVQLA